MSLESENSFFEFTTLRKIKVSGLEVYTMKWKMPDIVNKRRYKVDPCIITVEEDENIEAVAIAIAKASVEEGEAHCLGAISAVFFEISGKPLFTKDDEEWLINELKEKRCIKIDHWEGRSIKLDMKIFNDKTLHISVNSWIDRCVSDGLSNVPPHVINNLQSVLEVASGKKKSSSNLKPSLDVLIAAYDIKKELQQQTNKPKPHKSIIGQQMKNRFTESIAKKIINKYGCPRQRLSIGINASSWLPENVEKEGWTAKVKTVLPDGTILPDFTIDNKLNVIEGNNPL